MKLLLITILGLAIPSAFAKNIYDINFNLFADGKKITTGRIITSEGKSATLEKTDGIAGNRTEIKVLAAEGKMMGREGILVKFNVSHRGKRDRKINTEQELLVSHNVPAELTVGGEDETEIKLTLNVLKK